MDELSVAQQLRAIARIRTNPTDRKASVLIGRAECPECGFKSAHVKKSEKCTYRYCPECGSQHHARTERQVAALAAKTRPLGGPTDASPTATPTVPEKAAPAPALQAAPASTEPSGTPAPAPAKRRGLFT